MDRASRQQRGAVGEGAAAHEEHIRSHQHVEAMSKAVRLQPDGSCSDPARCKEQQLSLCAARRPLGLSVRRGVDLGVPVVVLGRILSDLHAACSPMTPVAMCVLGVGVLGRDRVGCGSQSLANVPERTGHRFCVVFGSELGSI